MKISEKKFSTQIHTSSVHSSTEYWTRGLGVKEPRPKPEPYPIVKFAFLSNEFLLTELNM
jgi:hypothetical protein